MMCPECANLADPTRRSATRDCDALIRDNVEWAGCGAAHSLAGEAQNASWIATYDAEKAASGRPCCVERCRVSRRAARRYAVAAWAMRRLEAGSKTRMAECMRFYQAFEGLPFGELNVE